MRRLLGDIPMYSIQMVLDHQHRIHAVRAGSLETSFAQAVDHADEHYVVDVDELYDIVVTVAPYPMDYDLYQSQKAMENGAMALADGGILILVSKCRHGIGDESLLQPARLGPDARRPCSARSRAGTSSATTRRPASPTSPCAGRCGG